MKITKKDFLKISLEELKKPKNNHICLINRYWVVTNDYALIYIKDKAYSPQCNTNKLIGATSLHTSLFSHVKTILIKEAYIPNHISY